MVYDLSVGRARDPLIAITVFLAIAVVTTVLRIQSKRLRKTDVGLDDWLLMSALFCLFISVGIQFACVLSGGVGRHIEDVNLLDVVKTLKLILPFEALYGVTLCLIKVSVIMFYRRIFGTSKMFQLSALVVISVLVMWAISVILETFLLCRPLAYNWDTSINGKCGDRNTVYVSAGALNVVTDFMVMSLPVPHILSLQLAFKRKIGLLMMFSLGLLITIISIIRIKSLQVISFTDPTYTLPMGLLWTTLEPCLCIINANLPMVRIVLATVLPTIFGSTSDQTSRKISTTTGLHGSRPDPFELIKDDRGLIGRGPNDFRLGQVGTEHRIRGGRSRQENSEFDSDSERHLTKGNNIIVERRVDVESL